MDRDNGEHGRKQSQAKPRSASVSYKALVVLYMAGGADSFNLLVPHSGCDEINIANQYVKTRSNVALDLDDIGGQNSSRNMTILGSYFRISFGS